MKNFLLLLIFLQIRANMLMIYYGHDLEFSLIRFSLVGGENVEFFCYSNFLSPVIVSGANSCLY